MTYWTVESVLREANTAFNLNTDLFTTIRSTSEEATKEIPVVIEHGPPEKTYPMAQVIAVVGAGGYNIIQSTVVLNHIRAVCLAHLILVVGGFTGNSGYQKLLALEAWFTRVWESRIAE